MFQGDVVRAQLVNGNQYKITDIIGIANDLGVENLAAAGMIAGETAKVKHNCIRYTERDELINLIEYVTFSRKGWIFLRFFERVMGCDILTPNDITLSNIQQTTNPLIARPV